MSESKCPTCQVNQIMGELDENGDGEIDFEEFMAMMSNQAGVF